MMTIQISGVTTDDVFRITGSTVNSSQISVAASVVELFTSVDISDFGRFGARDRFWIQKAVAYQAAWMLSQPGYLGRSDFASQSQDGLSFTTRDETTVSLAPLAKKALSRVTWVRPRTVYVRPGRQTRVANGSDAHLTYQPGTPVLEEMASMDGDWL